MTNLFEEATKRYLYITDGFEYVRTNPTSDSCSGHIKTTIGEAKVEFDNPTLFETMLSGREISEKEYFDKEICVRNYIN